MVRYLPAPTRAPLDPHATRSDPMLSMTHLTQGFVAARHVAPMACWPAADGPSVDRNRHHGTTVEISATYEVKPSFQASTRRPTEGSS